MGRAVGYGRISSDDPEDERANSISQQRRNVERAAAAAGFELVGWYTDVGVSGGRWDRPGLQDLLDVLPRVDAVVFDRQDRIARSGLVWERFRAECDRLGVRRISASEPHVGSGTSSAVLLESVGSGLAEVRRWDDAAATRRGLNGRASKGYWPGRPPYGWRSRGSTVDRGKVIGLGWEVVDDQARVIRRIFDEYLSGWSKRRIAQGLTADRVRSPSGRGRWSDRAVDAILRRPIYAGLVVWGRTRRPTPGGRPRAADDPIVVDADLTFHPPIVSRDVWERAQAELARRAQPGRRPGRSAPFTGVLRCRHCDGPMAVVRWETRAGERRGYRCDRRNRHGADACPGDWVREDVVIDGLWAALDGRWEPPETSRLRSAETDRLEAELVRVEAELGRAVDLRIVDGAPLDLIARRIRDLEGRRRRLRERIAAVRDVDDGRDVAGEIRATFGTFRRRFGPGTGKSAGALGGRGLAELTAAVRAHVDRIVVDDTGVVRVTWRV